MCTCVPVRGRQPGRHVHRFPAQQPRWCRHLERAQEKRCWRCSSVNLFVSSVYFGRFFSNILHAQYIQQSFFVLYFLILFVILALNIWSLLHSFISTFSSSDLLGLLHCLRNSFVVFFLSVRDDQAVSAGRGLGRPGLPHRGHSPWHLGRAPVHCPVPQLHPRRRCRHYHDTTGHTSTPARRPSDSRRLNVSHKLDQQQLRGEIPALDALGCSKRNAVITHNDFHRLRTCVFTSRPLPWHAEWGEGGFTCAVRNSFHSHQKSAILHLHATPAMGWSLSEFFQYLYIDAMYRQIAYGRWYMHLCVAFQHLSRCTKVLLQWPHIDIQGAAWPHWEQFRGKLFCPRTQWQTGMEWDWNGQPTTGQPALPPELQSPQIKY